MPRPIAQTLTALLLLGAAALTAAPAAADALDGRGQKLHRTEHQKHLHQDQDRREDDTKDAARDEVHLQLLTYLGIRLLDRTGDERAGARGRLARQLSGRRHQ